MESLDLYCERTSAAFTAEPLNAFSNAAYIAAAVLIAQRQWRSAQPDLAIFLLAGLAASVGIGSFLFHTFATPLTRLFDVVPIATFQTAYLFTYVWRVLQLSPRLAALAAALFLAVALVAHGAPEVLNGSLMYAPAIATVLVLGVIHVRRASAAPYALLTAAALMGGAVVFRTIDLAVCQSFPWGTHLLWHLGTAAAIYFALHALAAGLPLVRETPSPQRM